MILIFKYIFPKRYVGLTLWPLIILKDGSLKKDAVLINHERIHLKQQVELLILPFYLLYLMEWLIGLCYYGNFVEAYRNISFEKEAYQKRVEFKLFERTPALAFFKICF
ncbi:hypothetical protein [Galbibacter pacificus]|uniref:hypothetical protein n=1 Tax=Galbibacter pacificus TaxID=2996052 RepID=UPI0030D2107B